MRRVLALTALGAVSMLAGCASTGAPTGAASTPLSPTSVVTARGETQPVGTAHQDAADDPAIWRNAADPAGSLLVGTDKKAGLYAYGLDGQVRSFLPAGQLNNVALVEGQHGILVAASDRTDPLQSRVAFFALDRKTGVLTALGHVASGAGEAYGLCMAPQGGSDSSGVDRMRIYAAIKDGTVREITVSYAPGALNGKVTAEWKIPTQIEGCVVDEASKRLFVGEETVGIHTIDLVKTSAKPRLFAKADGKTLVADVEGLALAKLPGGRRVLLASSQGDNAYAAYDAASGAYLGRFRIGEGAIDGTSETDGIDVVTGDFGPGFPGGLFVAQDGDNGAGTQNFKLVAWDDIARALGL